jgi:O-antigen biosynthesis protein
MTDTQRLWSLSGMMRSARSATRLLRRRLMRRLRGPVKAPPAAPPSEFELTRYDDWISQFDTLSPADRTAIAAHIDAFAERPLISIVVPLYNTRRELLHRCIQSVREQLYPNWELCLVDDGSRERHVRRICARYARIDPRIRFKRRAINGHIAAATNSGLALASGKWIAFLDHDDELAPHALYVVAAELNQNPNLDLVFSDEDKIDDHGRRYAPWFKSDWNYDLMLSQNCIVHLAVYRHSILQNIGGMRSGFDGSQDYDLTLRFIEHTLPERIKHIPFILYHWRATAGSVAFAATEKTYPYEAAARAIQEHLTRISTDATVSREAHLGYYRVRWPLPALPPRVTVIIPTKDKASLLRAAVESILEKTEYKNFEIVIVDNRSEQRETYDYFSQLKACPNIRIISYDKPYSFARLNNWAVTQTDAPVLAFLNNDVEVIAPNWLSEMVSHALRPNVGAVGAKLYYPGETVQHAGIVVGIGGLAGHPHHRLPRGHPGYFGRAACTQQFSAVTAACMVMRREVFLAIGGFDELNFEIAFNDVDLGLRLRQARYSVVWSPYAELFHHESASLGSPSSNERRAVFEEECANLKRMWRDVIENDPFYNPNLTVLGGDFSLANPPRVEPPWKCRTLLPSTSPATQSAAGAVKTRFRKDASRNLAVFLSGSQRIKIPVSEHPEVSIVMVLFNQAELTFVCLQALARSIDVPVEVIIVDNASSDLTPELCARVDGVHIIRNARNLHFLRAVNQAVPQARGRAILLLNNDTLMKPGSIAAANDLLRNDASVGAVGGKIVMLNGALQEAGSIIWRDGTCVGYGRGRQPSEAEFQFRREVDYCSAAFLVVRRSLFQSLNWFDPIFEPAYYEEADLCMRIREAGFTVIYHPRIEVLHFEFGSSASSEAALALQKKNHKTFFDRHQNALLKCHYPSRTLPLDARTSRRYVGRILVIDDQVPDPALGRGLPRARALVQSIYDAGWFITFYPIMYPSINWDEAYDILPRDVEIAADLGAAGLKQFIESRLGYYDRVLVSRPHNMRSFKAAIDAIPGYLNKVKLIYDAEAVFCERENLRLQVAGRPPSPSERQERLSEEVGLTRGADLVLCVTEGEASHFREGVAANVAVLGHLVHVDPPPTPFEKRFDILFVGALDDDDAPNVDSIIWFVREIMPILDRRLGNTYRVDIVGSNKSRRAAQLVDKRIRFYGKVENLNKYYSRSRIFIAPARYAAGIPIKIYETAAAGLPAVATTLLARQLGWSDGAELLVADGPEEFAEACYCLYRDRHIWERVRNQALERVKQDCCPVEFRKRVASLLRAPEIAG